MGELIVINRYSIFARLGWKFFLGVWVCLSLSKLAVDYLIVFISLSILAILFLLSGLVCSSVGFYGYCKTKLRSLLLPSLIGLTLNLGMSCTLVIAVFEVRESNRDEMIAEFKKGFVAEQAALPQQITDWLRQDRNVYVDPNRFEYYYTITKDFTNEKPMLNTQQKLRDALERYYTDMDQAVPMTIRNVELVERYYDKDGEFLFELTAPEKP